jgi:Cu-Zn family superoxide dismutase
MRLAVTALAALAFTLPASALGGLAFGGKDKPNDLVVHLKTSTGTDAGTATFREAKDGKLKIKLQLKNLPEGDHAVHIHQNPVCDAPDFKTAGGHFNPDKKQHGLKNPMGHHNGDLPENLTVGLDGTVEKTFTIDYLSLAPDAPNSILANGGTSIMIHAKPDDMTTDPTGNAGNRIACGVIVPPAQ